MIPEPTADEHLYNQRMADERSEWIKRDRLVDGLENGQASGLDLLWGVAERVAMESAALKFDLERLAARCKDTGILASRRVAALKRLADLVLEIRRLGGDLHVRGKRFRAVEKAWMDTISAVVDEVLPPETGSLFMARLTAVMADWETRFEATQG